jgi:L-threonylcarbamoyladenylate synthase
VQTSPRPETEILSTETPELFEEAVRCAAELLRVGQVIALPTETVYGLAANALNPAAVGRIFEIKGRPAHNPIIAHVASLEMARHYTKLWPPLAQQLAEAFWPGPLTMVLPRADVLPDVLTAGGATVGIRWPSHPFMQAVIRRCGFPLAAPSANLANRVSPTNACHVLQQLGNQLPLIVDGGQAQVGIESTVLDLSVSPPRVLRPGMIHSQAILSVTGELAEATATSSDEPLKSPGLIQKHYAPRARLVLRAWKNDLEFEAQIKLLSAPRSRTHVIAHTHIPAAVDFASVSVIPHDAEAFARALYGQLHTCDELGAELIVVEALPETDEWRGLTDRLSRAAAD